MNDREILPLLMFVEMLSRERSCVDHGARTGSVSGVGRSKSGRRDEVADKKWRQFLRHAVLWLDARANQAPNVTGT